jgi:hypothetical protein
MNQFPALFLAVCLGSWVPIQASAQSKHTAASQNGRMSHSL